MSESAVIQDPEASVARPVLLVGSLTAWVCVMLVETFSVPNESLLVFLVPPVELALWLAAVGTTVSLIVLVGGWRRAVPVALVLAALCVYFNNWAAFEPRSYFVTHRYAFDRVADLVRDGRAGPSDSDDGVLLPLYLRDLSTTGHMVVLGDQDGLPVVFLPQWEGIRDGAGGYVFLDTTPRTDLMVDLLGEPAVVANGRDLGGGWWYL